jgi:hypothetical protein
VIVLLAITIKSCNGTKKGSNSKRDSSYSLEELIIIKPREAINKAKRVFRKKQENYPTKDTVISTAPFRVDYKDSTNGNINHFTYLFPQDTVLHYSQPAPDTSRTRTEKIKIETVIEKHESTWWNNVIYLLSGAFIVALIYGIF